MDILNHIKSLASIQRQGHLICSLYLRLWPDARLHRIKAKDLIREKKDEVNHENPSGNSPESGVKKLGRIGALLRYKPVIEKKGEERETEFTGRPVAARNYAG